MSSYIHEVPSDESYGREEAGEGFRGVGQALLYEVGRRDNGEMGVAEEPADYKFDFVFDEEALRSYFEVILSDNPCAADCMAQVLVRFKEAIESGEEGIARAIKSLSDGVELMYVRTEVHRAALKLYTLSQLGYVRPEDEPMAVLGPAIERSLAEAEHEAEQAADRGADHSEKRKRTAKKQRRRRTA